MDEEEWLSTDHPEGMLRVVLGRISKCCRTVWHRSISGSYYLTEGQISCLCCKLNNEGRLFHNVTSERKLQLLACAFYRGIVHNKRPLKQDAQEVVEYWELVADGKIPDNKSADELLFGRDIASVLARITFNRGKQNKSIADIIRDIVGNPFRRVTLDDAYRTPEVMAVAKGVYQERRPDGTLDPDGLAQLSDLLEEAGLSEEQEMGPDILWALRGVVGCSHCEGVGVIYTSPALSSRQNCPVCEGRGLIRDVDHWRGFWCLDDILNLS